MARRDTAMTSCTLNGLLMESNAPSRTDSIAVSSVPKPLIRITCVDGETSRKVFNSAIPFKRSFRLMSLTIRSNLRDRTASSAASASSAELTLKPSSSKISRRKLQVSRSSSITRMFFDNAFIFKCLFTAAIKLAIKSIRLFFSRRYWLHDRESDSELGALPGVALDFYHAAVFPDYLTYDRQPQSAAPPAQLRGEERVENAGLDFVFDAFACVTAFDLDVAALGGGVGAVG